MAEDKEQKTEAPTGKRIADARKKGNIPRSADLNSAVIVFASAVLLLWQWHALFEVTRERMVTCLGDLPTRDFTIPALQNLAVGLTRDVVVAVAPILLALTLVGVVTSVSQTGFHFSWEGLKPSAGKLNPINGFKRIFSLRGVIETFKGVLKIAVVGYFSYQVIQGRYVQIVTAIQLDRAHLGALLGDTSWAIAWRSALSLFVLGVADYAYQRWDWWRNLKMTKQEVKDEHKQQEGSQEVKGAIKKKALQAARRRMMQEVPKASVVVTNPTHFAVALRYERDGMEVPIVVAKGTDLVAKRIRDIAREHQVPLVENKPVAQALYRQVEVGDAIPAEMYAVVAEILVAVSRADKKTTKA